MARVPYVESEDVPEEHRDLLVSSLQDRPLHVYQAIGNNPAVLAGMRGFFSSLWNDSGLSDRERELVILAVSRAIESRYEYHQHVNIAREVGIGDDTIAAIGDGELARLGDDERILVEYALAIVDGEVDAVTHDVIAHAYADEAVVGIAATAMGYVALGGLIDAFDLELEGETFHGWDPR